MKALSEGVLKLQVTSHFGFRDLLTLKLGQDH